MEVAQAVSAGQVVEKWNEYIDQVVAGFTGLDEAAIDELRAELVTEISLLELDDVADTEWHGRLMEKGRRLFGSHQESAAVARTVVADLVRPKAPLSPPSSFPVSNASALPSVDNVLQRFEELMGELRQHGDYHRIRDEYCQLSILLNLQGVMAPAFRPALVTGKKFGDRVFNAIHRDQIVIDCHWLYATKQFVKVRAKDTEYAPMFSFASPFPFGLAWSFANKNWKANHRVVDMLRLTESQQCQLGALRSDEVKEKIRRIEHGHRKDNTFIPSPLAVFEQGLTAWCERDKRIWKYREGYVAVWKARSFLGKQASVRQVAVLAALMLGESAKDEKTIRAKEEKISRHIFGE